MTLQHALALTAVIGARLLRRVGFILQTGGRLTFSTSTNNVTENYYRMPNENDFDDCFLSIGFLEFMMCWD